MTKEKLERDYPAEAVAAKLELERRYAAAVATKDALGPDHDEHDSCDCPICDEERELYFIDKHFLDGVPRLHDAPPNGEQDDPPAKYAGQLNDDWLRDEEIPF